MCFLAMIAYYRPGPEASEIILQMAAWAFVKMIASTWILDAATRRALAIAVTGFLTQPMWALWLVQVSPFFQVTSLPVAPFSGQVPSVESVSPGRHESCASRMASASSIVVVASRGLQPQVGPSLALRSSTRGMTGVVGRACCPGSGEFPGLVAPWEAARELEGKAPEAVVQLCRRPDAGLSPDSMLRAPWLRFEEGCCLDTSCLDPSAVLG